MLEALPQIEPPRRLNPNGAQISPLYTTATLLDALPQIEPTRHRFNPNETPTSTLITNSTLYDALPQIESSLPVAVNPNGARISAYCMGLSGQRIKDVETMDALDLDEEEAWIGKLMAVREVGSGLRIVQKVALLVGVGALIMVLRM